jgi:hypothetical protein
VSADDLNQSCFERLENAKLSSRVAVVGAGASSPYIAPLDNLIERLKAECGVSWAPDEEFWDYCERAHIGNAVKYFDVIRETYADTPQWTAKIYRHLLNIPFAAFATLNYDDQLPSEHDARYPNARRFSVYPPAVDESVYFMPQELLGSPPGLIALHGYCDSTNPEWPKQVILKQSDYSLHYIAKAKPLFYWWVNMLLSAPCIFIGTRLHEPGLYRVMEYLLAEDRDKILGREHLHLVPVHHDAGASIQLLTEVWEALIKFSMTLSTESTRVC